MNATAEYLKLKITSDFKTQVYDRADIVDPNDDENWDSLTYGYALAAVHREPGIDVSKLGNIVELAGSIGLYINNQVLEWEINNG